MLPYQTTDGKKGVDADSEDNALECGGCTSVGLSFIAKISPDQNVPLPAE